MAVDLLCPSSAFSLLLTHRALRGRRGRREEGKGGWGRRFAWLALMFRAAELCPGQPLEASGEPLSPPDSARPLQGPLPAISSPSSAEAPGRPPLARPLQMSHALAQAFLGSVALKTAPGQHFYCKSHIWF